MPASSVPTVPWALQHRYDSDRFPDRIPLLPPPDATRLAPVLVGLVAGQVEDAAAELQRHYSGKHGDNVRSQPMGQWPGSTGCVPASRTADTPATPAPAGLGASAANDDGGGNGAAQGLLQRHVVQQRGPHLLGMWVPGLDGTAAPGTISSSPAGHPLAPVDLTEELSFQDRDQLDKAVASTRRVLQVSWVGAGTQGWGWGGGAAEGTAGAVGAAEGARQRGAPPAMRYAGIAGKGDRPR